jgi:FkbM family methyltransferase
VIRAGNTWVPDGDAYFSRYFAGADVFEQHKLDAGLARVKHWRTAVDVGAHVGSWTRALAARFARVIAFEPQPANLECLHANCPMPNVERYGVALGDRCGTASLVPGTNTGCWHISGDGPTYVMKLDMWHLTDLDFLKLDVEGFEPFVLAGAEKTIKTCHPVIVMEEKDLRHSYPVGKASDVLKAWGYTEAEKLGPDSVWV